MEITEFGLAFVARPSFKRGIIALRNRGCSFQEAAAVTALGLCSTADVPVVLGADDKEITVFITNHQEMIEDLLVKIVLEAEEGAIQ